MSADIRGIGSIVPGAGWLRSSRCNIQGNCIELNLSGNGVVLVRDSKGAGANLSFAGAPWSTFLRTL
jgi:Domain of unknown function (DUF397)